MIVGKQVVEENTVLNALQLVNSRLNVDVKGPIAYLVYSTLHDSEKGRKRKVNLNCNKLW